MESTHKSRIVLFYSPQGGAGKSTLAVNTAIFNSLAGNKTLLIDMSMFGGIMATLRIPQKGGYGLSAIITLLELDIKSAKTGRFSDVVKGSIVKSDVIDNLDVLISANPIKMDIVNEKHTKIIVDIMRSLDYDTIIVDSSSDLCERNIVLLDEADSIIIPVIQDMSCGWKMVLFKEVMERYSLDSKKIKLVVNKCSKFSGFNNMEFEREIGYKIIDEIPLFIKKFQCFVNEGILINTMRSRRAYKKFQHTSSMILKNKANGQLADFCFKPGQVKNEC